MDRLLHQQGAKANADECEGIGLMVTYVDAPTGRWCLLNACRYDCLTESCSQRNFDLGHVVLGGENDLAMGRQQ